MMDDEGENEFVSEQVNEIVKGVPWQQISGEKKRTEHVQSDDMFQVGLTKAKRCETAKKHRPHQRGHHQDAGWLVLQQGPGSSADARAKAAKQRTAFENTQAAGPILSPQHSEKADLLSRRFLAR